MVKRTKKLPKTVDELKREIKGKKVDSSDSSDSSSDSDGSSVSKVRRVTKATTKKTAVGVKDTKAAAGSPVDDRVPDRLPDVVADEDKMRNELIRLSEDGDLDKSVAYLKKASKKIIMKIHGEVQKKRMDKANEFLTDLLISKWAETLGGLDAIGSSDELSSELRKDSLLRSDVIRAVSLLTPYIPLLGILSGGVTCVRHILAHKTGDTSLVPATTQSSEPGTQTGQLSQGDAQTRHREGVPQE